MGKPSAPAPPDYTPIAMASQNQLAMSDEQVKAQEAEAQQSYDLASRSVQNQQDQAGKQFDLANDVYNLTSKAYDTANAQSGKQYDLANEEFQASKAAQDQQYGLQQDQLDWAKQVYGDQKAQSQEIADSQVQAQQFAQKAAQDAQNRYQTVYQPLEDQSVAEARDYNSPGNRDLLMGGAAASAAQATEQARQAAQSNLESFGIDPSSTRYAAMDAGIRIQGAAAQAGAATSAGLQADATGRALRANAINVGRGLPSDVNAGINTSVGAGSAAANTGISTANAGGNLMGTSAQYGALGGNLFGAGEGAINAGNGAIAAPGQYLGYGINAINAGSGAIGAGNGAYGAVNGSIGAGNGALGAANSAIGTWGSTLNQGYQNQMSAYTANMNASSGFGALLGTAAGFIPGLADGGAVPGGAAVPVEASPTGGRAIDDVPARLTPGEFVVPKDVMQWEGEKSFQKLIEKARKDKASAGAQPRMMAVPMMQRPTFTSPGAIPAR